MTECWTANQGLTECCISIIGNFQCIRGRFQSYHALFTGAQSLSSHLMIGRRASFQVRLRYWTIQRGNKLSNVDWRYLTLNYRNTIILCLFHRIKHKFRNSFVPHHNIKVKLSGPLVGYTTGAYPCFNDVDMTSVYLRAPPQADGWYSFTAESTEAMRS